VNAARCLGRPAFMVCAAAPRLWDGRPPAGGSVSERVAMSASPRSMRGQDASLWLGSRAGGRGPQEHAPVDCMAPHPRSDVRPPGLNAARQEAEQVASPVGQRGIRPPRPFRVSRVAHVARTEWRERSSASGASVRRSVRATSGFASAKPEPLAGWKTSRACICSPLIAPLYLANRGVQNAREIPCSECVRGDELLSTRHEPLSARHKLLPTRPHPWSV